MLLVGAYGDSTCWDMKSGAGGNTSSLCHWSGAVYVLGRNTSVGVGAGEYERAGMVKAPAASVMSDAYFGWSMGSAGTLVAVGALGERDGGVDCGAVHVYRWDGLARSEAVDGGDLVLNRSVSLEHEGRLVPSVKEGGQWFGPVWLWRCEEEGERLLEPSTWLWGRCMRTMGRVGMGVWGGQ